MRFNIKYAGKSARFAAWALGFSSRAEWEPITSVEGVIGRIIEGKREHLLTEEELNVYEVYRALPWTARDLPRWVRQG